MQIVIIKYNAGNIRSVNNSLLRLGHHAIISDNPEVIGAADRVIFPGVGEASTTMQYLNQTGLADVIRNLKQPVLGICLGMQLMCSHSAEGDVDCLGIFNEPVLKFKLPTPNDNHFKVPHMGWNTLTDVKNPLFTPAQEGEHVYFVHSYYVPIGEDTAATTRYSHPFSAALRKNNFFATQFHPEKSGSVGESILKTFLSVTTK